jgi:hypothetical protein
MFKGKSRLAILSSIGCCVALLSFAGAARAETVTFGSPLTGAYGGTLSGGGVLTFANTTLPGAAKVTSPIDGTVVRFRAKGSLGFAAHDLFQLQVLTPIGGGMYSVRGSSKVVQSDLGPGVQTFETALPIKVGDLIGLHPVIEGGFIPIETVAGATLTQMDESTPGEPLGTLNTFGYEVGLNADVQTLPTLTSIAPTSGPNSGGTSVVINGTGFEEVAEVKFGSEPAQSYTVESETKISAIAPENVVGGKVDVSVSTLAGPTAAGSAFFTYPAPPIVSSASPAAGPTGGGTAVDISGVNFKEVSAVEFGGVPATGFTVDSESQITAMSPAHAVGPVAVTVTTPVSTSGGTSDTFSYKAAPTVSGISPAIGPTSGGTTVTVTGLDFEEVSAVEFGGVAASSFTVDSGTQITAVSPAHSAGAVPLTVTTTGGTSGGTTAQFTYEAPAAQTTGGNGDTTPPPVNAPPAATPPAAKCVVPKLKGKKLKAAKKTIIAADCKVGNVTKAKDVTAKTGKVVKQSPKVGTSKAAGSKVNVKLV